MKSTRHFPLLLAGLLALSPPVWAQNNDNYEVPPMTFGGFNTQGSAEIGYRFTELKGFQPMYKELFDLESGPRLLDFNMFGEAREGANPFADSYSLSLSGLGGDPFPMFGTAHAKLRGFRHVYIQYLGEIPAPADIQLYSPFNNRECLHCHAGMRAFEEHPKHSKTPEMMKEIMSNEMSCMTSKCHDTVHDVGTLKDVSFWKGTQ